MNINKLNLSDFLNSPVGGCIPGMRSDFVGYYSFPASVLRPHPDSSIKIITVEFLKDYIRSVYSGDLDHKDMGICRHTFPFLQEIPHHIEIAILGDGSGLRGSASLSHRAVIISEWDQKLNKLINTTKERYDLSSTLSKAISSENDLRSGLVEYEDLPLHLGGFNKHTAMDLLGKPDSFTTSL